MKVTLAVSSEYNPIVQTTAQAIQVAVLHQAAECRAACRQAKRLIWPVARAWHALTGWPQASVEKPTNPALLPTLVSIIFQAAGGVIAASVGCICGWLGGGARPQTCYKRGAIVGELIATPVHTLLDLVGLAGGAALSVASLALDMGGAIVGIAAGMLCAPCTAYRAARDASPA